MTVAGLPINTIKLAAEWPDPLLASIAFGDGPYADVPVLATGDFPSFLLESILSPNPEDRSSSASETEAATAGQEGTDEPRPVSPSGDKSQASSNAKNGTLNAPAVATVSAVITPPLTPVPLGSLFAHCLPDGDACSVNVLEREPQKDAGRFWSKPLPSLRPDSAGLAPAGNSPEQSLSSARLVVAETPSITRLIPAAQPNPAGKNGAVLRPVSPVPRGLIDPQLQLVFGPSPTGGWRAASQSLVAPLSATEGTTRPIHGSDPLSFVVRIKAHSGIPARPVALRQVIGNSAPSPEGTVRSRNAPTIPGVSSVPKGSVSVGAATPPKVQKQSPVLADAGRTDEGRAALQPNQPGGAVRPGEVRSTGSKGSDGQSIDRRRGGMPAPVRPAGHGGHPQSLQLHTNHGVVADTGGKSTAGADGPSSSRAARPAELVPSRADADPPARASLPVRHFAVKIAGDSERSVSLSITDRGGQLHIAVRTPAPELNQALGRNIGNLVARIASHGGRVDAWSPHGYRPLSHHAIQAPAEPRFSEGGGGDHTGAGADQRQGRQQQQQPGWVDDLTSSGSSARKFDEEVKQWLQASWV